MPKSEVVVVLNDSPAAPGLGMAAGSNAVEKVLAEFKAKLAPVFPRQPSSPFGMAAAASAPEAREQAKFRVALVSKDAEAMADKLRALPEVEAAYVKPPVFNPFAPNARQTPVAPGGAALGLEVGAPAPVQDFSAQQVYLNAAPAGIGAKAAWPKAGGKGKGVRVIDIEGGWCFTHVDLLQNSGGVKAGTAFPQLSWRNHGTAVLGEIGGDHNGIGVQGISPDAVLSAISHGSLGSAGAIARATALLAPGDILLLEMHRPGPRFAFANRADQRGFIAVEWWPDDLAAIRAAVNKGIIVIEAAGNGGENFDDPLYDINPNGQFPASWKNPLDGTVDSGAIVVGAGAPAGGAHGPPRSRLDFSNFGKRVDCQGWGRGVVTTGYGDLTPGAVENEFFTATFSGTSSASPIVTGAVAVMQGIAKAKNKLLKPLEVRKMLRQTGTPQVASPIAPLSQRIGNQPDLAQLIPLI
jgi:subtilisin family serine protease